MGSVPVLCRNSCFQYVHVIDIFYIICLCAVLLLFLSIILFHDGYIYIYIYFGEMENAK